MITHLPLWIEVLFLICAIVVITIFHFINGRHRLMTAVIVTWCAIQSILSSQGFYQVLNTMPPRYALVLIPPLCMIIYGLLPAQRTASTAYRNITLSTALHTIRIPIEIVLLHLYLHNTIPRLMTFEGRNFDIIIGLTAPIVTYLFYKKRIHTTTLIVWNIIGLILVTLVLINGILSAELPFQQFAFDQPNRAVTFFPFVLLPTAIVPIIIYTHVMDIIKLNQLRIQNKNE